jgi:hypothetical protein
MTPWRCPTRPHLSVQIVFCGVGAGKVGHVWGSCAARHTNNPVLCDVRRGDAMMHSPLVSCLLTFWKSKMLKKHIRKADCQLEPREVRILHVHLIGTRIPADFQFYTMSLTGIRLFPQINKVLTLTVETFCESMFIVEPTKVCQLCC